MHQTAFARRHRSEGVWHAALAHAVGGNISREAKFLLARRAKILAIEDDLVVLVGTKPQHLERDMLEGAQQFSSALQHQRAVGAREFHLDDGLVEIALGHRWIHEDLVAKTEVASGDNAIQQFANFLGRCNFVGYRHSRSTRAASARPFSSPSQLRRNSGPSATSRPCGHVSPPLRAFPYPARCGSSRIAG